MDSSEATNGRPDNVNQKQVAEDFDRLTEVYEDKINEALAFGGQEHGFYIDVKKDHLLRLAKAYFGRTSQLDVLDLGCGIGAYHARLDGKFRQLHGFDVSARSVEVAREKHPSIKYESSDGGVLPYPSDSFDLIFTICVMHHVPTGQWVHFVNEMFRVLKPAGLAVVFEHNPYNPATQYIVRSCEIDKDAVLLRPAKLRKLFKEPGFADINTKTILSVPPIGTALSRLDSMLGYLPFGAQYYLSAVKPE
ncbi:MAG: class I SAM-dependent methyltransferase [Hyphomicrobiaceae bacterium]